MSFKVKASSGGGGSEAPPAGSHPAVLVGIVDLGTHEVEYEDKKKSTVRKIMLAWELTAEQMSGSKRNHCVARDYTLTFSKKSALRGLVEAWRGKAFVEGEEFDVEKMLGKSCVINLSHKTSKNDKTYAKIESVGPVPKGLAVPPPQIEPVLWEVGSPLSDLEAVADDWLPFLYGEKVTAIVQRCHELSGKPAAESSQTPVAIGVSDEVPF